MSKSAQKSGSTQRHKEGSYRFAEKRRTATCLFADRVATTALETYRRVVPQAHRDRQKHECVAAILAHFPSPDEPSAKDAGNSQKGGTLQVIGLGVGTKFLSESILREEEDTSERYGERLRDCHAEVLARRAFRWQLTKEIRDDLLLTRQAGEYGTRQQSNSHYISMLQRLSAEDDGDGSNASCKYGIKPGVTLHFYSSSAPCGNATLKKFAKMQKEKFDDSLGADKWPSSKPHEIINGHAIREGQFSLLLKKDNGAAIGADASIGDDAKEDGPNADAAMKNSKPKGKQWPANASDEWCPPGCTIAEANRGSIHTCSDKIARWNCLGLQGSLLSSMLDVPLYMATLTVGRKMSNVICRRAVCCRAWGYGDTAISKMNDNKRAKIEESKGKSFTKKSFTKESIYKLNHPVIMGTSVYIDEDGVLDMTGERSIGQDIRFDSNLCWAFAANWDAAECINGRTGFLSDFDPTSEVSTGGSKRGISQISTAALTEQFAEVSGHKLDLSVPTLTLTLATLLSTKSSVSPEHELAKENLLTKHRVFRQWVRRTATTPTKGGR